MTKSTKIGYLVPQFPSQTHIFFWREILDLECLGVDPVLFSTRHPPAGLIAHSWSATAMARTTYLATPSPLRMLRMLSRLPWRELLIAIRKDGISTLKDVIMSIPAADRLAHGCADRGITHVHVHSCGRAALIAALAARTHDLSYSLSLHGPLSDYGSAQGFKWRRAKFVSVITQHLLDGLPALIGADLPDHLPIQPMGVDTDTLKPDGPYTPANPNEPLRLFSCARLKMGCITSCERMKNCWSFWA